MNRKLFLLIALLACLALPLGHLAAQDSAAADPSAPDAADFLPDEPNDTFTTATPWSDFWDIADFYYPSYRHDGYFLTAADVDYYAFQSDAIYWDNEGVFTAIDIDPLNYDIPTTLRVELALFDAAHNLVAEDVDCESGGAAIWKPNAPAGNYFIRVRPCAGTHDANQPYKVDANMVVPYDVAEVEPNDMKAQATPIAYGQMVGGTFEDDYPCDQDWFRFEGRAGDRMPAWFMSGVFDANGIQYDVLPVDGVYYLLISSR